MDNQPNLDHERSSPSRTSSSSPSDLDLENDKSQAFQIEASSILEAIEVSSTTTSNQNDPSSPHDDLEKCQTQQTQASTQLPTRIPTAQDWSSPSDPSNPQNWPLSKKIRHVFPVAFLSFSVTVGSSIISPASSDISAHFHVSQTASILPLTLFVVGLGVGPVFAAPLSESFGRTMVYKISPPIFLLFTLGAGMSTRSFGGLLVCRLLAGMAGSPVLAIGGGTNADMFPPATRALATAMYIMAPFLGPAVGPVIGGFAAEFKGWRWCLWCLIFIGTLAWVFCLPMEETYKKVILQRRAKKLGIPGPPRASVSGFGYVKLLLTLTVARPMHMLCFEPVVAFFSIYTAFTFSVLFAFFAAYPYTFETVYGFNTWQYGLTFLGIGIGVLLAAMTVIICDIKIYRRKYREGLKQGRANVAPEHRLYAGMMGAFGLPIGLFWFAWTAQKDIHWIVPTLAGIPFAWGNLSLFLSASMYCIDVYGPLNGASALAANGFLRYVLGGCFPLFTLQMYRTLGIGWATSLLGFVCVLLLPIPFVFFKYGRQIRAKSHYETMKA